MIASGVSEHVPFASPQPGWAEQDPVDWWKACGLAVRQALQISGLRGDEIGCVGFSGQMHGAVLLDAEGEVVRPALIWCDQRSQLQCDWITAQVGSERLIQLVSNPALTGFSAPKLLWIRDHEPAIFDRNCNGWVRIPKNVKLPDNQQDRDMMARELLIKFQMSPNHPMVQLNKAYRKV